jgi:hypothetical protein
MSCLGGSLKGLDRIGPLRLQDARLPCAVVSSSLQTRRACLFFANQYTVCLLHSTRIGQDAQAGNVLSTAAAGKNAFIRHFALFNLGRLLPRRGGTRFANVMDAKADL